MKRRLWALIVMFAMVFSLLPAAPALADSDPISYDTLYRWTGLGITGTRSDTMQFKMTDGYIAFCVDENIVIRDFIDYVKVPLDHSESSNMFDNESADPDKIRAILTYAWDKTDRDEITAIQYALWNEMHGTNLPVSVNNNIKYIFNKLVDDSQTPPISALSINENVFTLTAPSPDSKPYIYTPSTTEYSFDFEAFSGANIVFAVFDENDDEMATDDYEITDNGSGSYTLKLKDVTGPAGFRLEATTLKDTAVEAFVFMSINDDSEEINISRSQTVAGIKLSDTTQTKSFNVSLHYTATGSLNLSGTKTLTGRDLRAGEFNFALYEGSSTSGTPFRTASNNADGSFSFGPINYDQDDIGSKTYTVVEQTGTTGGISYDENSYTVTVNITDNGNGTLTATPNISGNNNGIVFNNTYSATGNISFSGNKEISGRDLNTGEFRFALYEGTDTSGTPFMTATNNTDGSFSFEPINYTLADVGPKTYTIVEEVGTLGGVSYDDSAYTMIVNISDNGDGTLSINYNEASDDPEEIVFNNTYTATGSLNLSGTKTLTGRDLRAGEFNFALYEGSSTSGTPFRTASNNADGSFSFGPINYDQDDIGSKTYTVVEQTGTTGGISYDENSYTVTVNITDNGNGTLTATPNISGNNNGIVFNNTYSATGNISFSGNKEISGRDLNAGEFSFALFEGTDTTGTPFMTATNNTDGSFSFGPINYTLADVGPKTYTIVELEGTLGGVSYDDSAYTMIVNISDNGDGTLSINYNEASDDPEEIVFNNTYTATGSLDLSGTKALTGRDLRANEFNFALYEGSSTSGTPFRTASNNADGSFSFGTINYTLADVGLHTYTVAEQSGSLGGVDYDERVYTIAVVVSDNGDGKINVAIAGNSDDPEAISFTNTYSATGNISFSGIKEISGRDLNAGEFSFALFEGTDTTGTPFMTATNNTDGSFSFGPINYTLADVGPKTYTIVEQDGTLGGVSYDDSAYTMIVNISDEGDGTLDISFDEESNDPDEIVFNNTYTAEGSLDLTGYKTLSGRDLAAGEFTFELFEVDNMSDEPFRSAINEADGSFNFESISYTLQDVGTKTYTVVEQSGELGGVSYDTNTYTVTVTITDNGDGTLTAVPSISGDNDGIVFNNSYEATGSISFSGNKEITGRSLNAGEFTFELYELTDYYSPDLFNLANIANSERIDTTTNNADGSFTFSTVNFTLDDVGIKTYTIVEQAGTLGGVDYDESVYTIIVNISDNGDGTLSINYNEESDDPEAINFTNTYSATGSLELTGNKTLTGRDLAAEEFTFELFEGDDTSGTPFSTASNDADGNFSFETINFNLDDVGSKIYTVVEQTGTTGGISYDTNAYTVTVTITDNGDGTLTAEPSISGDNDGISFTNSYSATGSISFSGTKEITGRDLTAGEFTFELFEGDDTSGTPFRTANNDIDGNFSFETINFNLDDVGVKTYTIVEQAGTLGGVDYDESVYTIIVSISDNGDGTLSIDYNGESDDPEAINFTNTYSATGSLDLSGTKTLTGRDLAAGEFTFELFEGTDTSGTPFSTASNDADGNFSFETISYNLADVGTRTYTIRELAGGLAGIIYDTNTYTVIVNISDNGDGTLAVDITDESDDPDNISFINTVTAIIVEEEEPPLAEPTPAPLPTIKPIINIPLAPADPTLPTIEVVQEQLPQSGENAPLWPVGIALIAIAGGMAYLLNRKKRAEND